MIIEHPHFDPVAFSLGPLSVHWYGLMYLLAFLFFWLLGRYRIKKGIIELPYERLDDLIFYGVLGVVLGGRLGYVLFYQPSFYFHHPLNIFKVWDGGMSFHGGLLGVLIAIGIFAYRQHKSFFQISDMIAPMVPLGLAFGRWGNFVNGELWGRPTYADWGMIFPQAGLVPRHPSQLYEMCLEGILLFIILWFYSKKPRQTGKISALFLIGYGIFRFGVEYTREPDYFLGTLALGLSMGQWLSLPMIIIGVIIYWRATFSKTYSYTPKKA